MKKIISLALATSMVAGMAVTAFAATDPKTEPVIKSTQMYAKLKATTALGIKSAYIPFYPDSNEADYDSSYGFEVDTNGLSDAKMNYYAAFAKWSIGQKFIDGDPVLQTVKMETTAPDYDMVNAAWEAGDKVVVKYTTTEAGTTLNGLPNGVDAGALVEFTMTLDKADYKDAADLAAKRTTIIENATIVATKADKGALADYKIADMTKTDRNALKAAAVAAFDANYVSTLITEGKYEYRWFVTFNTIWSSEFKNFRDVRGELTVAKKTTGGRDNFKLAISDPIRSKVIAEVNFNGINTDIDDFFTLNGEVEDLEFDGCVFTVDTVGMSNKIYKWNGTGFNKDVVAKFPNAVLSFFDFVDAKNPTFNRTGTLAFYTTDKNAKVYEILADGSLKLLDSKYDEKIESVTIKTRTLGNYVVSDVELVLDAPVVDAPVVDAPVDDVKPNPETGR